MEQADNRKLFGDMCELSFRKQYEAELAACANMSVKTSARHRRKMKEITGVKVPSTCSVKTKVLVILAAAVLILLLTACAVAYGDRIGDFIIEYYEDHIVVLSADRQVPNAENSTITTYYTLGYVPEGYEKVNEEQNTFRLFHRWENSDRKQLSFTQMKNWGVSGWDRNQAEKVEILDMGVDVYQYKMQDSCVWFWKNGDYYYMIKTEEDLSLEEVKRMIAGVSVIE